MKKILSVIILLLVVTLLGACGKKSQGDVIKMLGQKAEDMKAFEVNAEMKINENETSHVFDVNVKYKAPDFYKVTLKNRDSNNVQIVLKNKDGVYVLTPALNKSFKFQSDWPLNSSQPYLFQSLVKDILNDEDAIYVKQDGNYVFETKVDYRRSKDLTSQKVIINSKTLFPKEVSVYDSENNEKIKVIFGDVNFKPKFSDNEFQIEESMTSSLELYKDVLPTFEERSILYPTNLETGTHLVEETIKNIDDRKRAIMTFGGTSTFTLVEEYVSIEENMELQYIYGDPVVTASGIAFLTETSLTWHNNGIELFIISDTMDADQLYEVANGMMSETKK